MDDIIWRMPGEGAWERLEELEQAISDLPNSPLTPMWEREVEELQKLLHYD